MSNEEILVNEWLKKIKHVTLGRNDVYSDYKELKFLVRLKCSLHLAERPKGSTSLYLLFKFLHNPSFFPHNQHIFRHNFSENFHINFFPHPVRCPVYCQLTIVFFAAVNHNKFYYSNSQRTWKKIETWIAIDQSQVNWCFLSTLLR